MSTALAIASVTHVLKDLLNNGLIDQNVSGATGGNVNVTALPPDRIDISSSGQSQLNLFMYRVTPNTGWNNLGYPTFNAKGERTGNQPLAINLHYLLTAYASTELHTEILLGYGMQLLHEMPFLDRDAIQYSLSPANAEEAGGLPDDLRALATSNLAQQPELIKIVQEQINTEEISKLWAAFQAKYRPSVAYMASVVLIESDISAKPSLPVNAPQIMSFPFNNIVIDKLLSRVDASAPASENQKILTGYQIIINGKNLYSTNITIKLNTNSISSIDSANDDEIIFTIPSTIPSGIQSLKVIHSAIFEESTEEKIVDESNVMPFILCPTISSISSRVLFGSGTNRISGEMDITLTPGIDINQKAVLLLNEYNPSAQPDQLHAYTFNAPVFIESSPPGSLISAITIPYKNVTPGIYIVRIQVDGAESSLGDRDASGYFLEPNIIIN